MWLLDNVSTRGHSHTVREINLRFFIEIVSSNSKMSFSTFNLQNKKIYIKLTMYWPIAFSRLACLRKDKVVFGTAAFTLSSNTRHRCVQSNDKNVKIPNINHTIPENLLSFVDELTRWLHNLSTWTYPKKVSKYNGNRQPIHFGSGSHCFHSFELFVRSRNVSTTQDDVTHMLRCLKRNSSPSGNLCHLQHHIAQTASTEGHSLNIQTQCIHEALVLLQCHLLSTYVVSNN